ncbi:hypothetical protein NQ318_014887 [Aromia moschata]|uniref:Uncharacterized protein n=1 Tax=Aromia moschata TaxID=1265417 RepID=A0AAV8YTH7_9CUCU|nr:hypothetical protein NQ318_014887 [Aromia moschata]
MFQAETPNPEVSVWIVNLTTPKYLFPFELKPTNSVEPDSYVTSVSFHGENNVAVIWLNRLQNVYVIVTCRSQNSYNCTDFHIEREHIGWTEPIFHPVFNANGTKVLVRLPVKDGDNGHYMHACEIFNNKVKPLTHGAFELTRILAWDEERQYIYAIGTIENAPGVRHLIRISNRNSSPEWICMTCRPEIDANMTYSDNMNDTMINNSLWLDYPCDFNNVIFSRGYKYYVQECLGPEIPIVLLVKTSTNARHAVLDTSFKLRRKVRKLSPPQMKTISVEIEFGYKAQVRLYLPGVLREYEDVTFPLVLLVDAAPSSQTVSSRWELSWPWYLASTRNYVVASIDARGSGFQGIKMRREVQRRIGLIEVQDQLAVLTYLRDAFKFIDRSKICTAGEGYGGLRLRHDAPPGLPPGHQLLGQHLADHQLAILHNAGKVHHSNRPASEKLAETDDVWVAYLAGAGVGVATSAFSSEAQKMFGGSQKKRLMGRERGFEGEGRLGMGRKRFGHPQEGFLKVEWRWNFTCSGQTAVRNSYFSEKYLGFPSKHLQEYDNADLTLKAANLNERNLLLIHGTADTQVSPQHSLMLARALVDQDILFHHLVYPDEEHDFGRKALLHMYKEIDQYFNDSFGPVVDEWSEDSSFFI